MRSTRPDGVDARPSAERTEDVTVDHMASVAAIAQVVSVLSPDQADVVPMRVVRQLDPAALSA